MVPAPLSPGTFGGRRYAATSSARREERALEQQPRVEVEVLGQLGARLLDPGQPARGAEHARAADPAAGRGSCRRSGPPPTARGDPIAQQRRDRQQHPVDVVALGAPLPALEPDLDPLDRAAVGVLGPAASRRGTARAPRRARPSVPSCTRRRRRARRRRPRAPRSGPSAASAIAPRARRRGTRRPSAAIASRRARPRFPPASRAASRARISVDALADQHVDDERLRQRRERHDVASRQDGVGQLVRAGRHQQEHGVGRRLLEDLQQRVGGRGREPVGLADHEHLAARARAPCGRRASRPPRGSCPRGCRGPRAPPGTRSGGDPRAPAGTRGTSPHPPSGHRSAATNARAAIDLPEPSGPANTYA